MDTQIVGLYERFARDLSHVREQQRDLYERCGYSRLQPLTTYRALRFAARSLGLDWERGRFMNPQFDDIEAELTYLRIRALRPDVVIELGAFRGWSTTWILRALRDNANGALISFDLVDDSLHFVPTEIASRWKLVVGGVREHVSEMPEHIDYLFVDADHRASFARWYLAELMPRVSGGVSVHDIFHTPHPTRSGGEAQVVIEWLNRRQIAWMTASPLASPALNHQIVAVRQSLGFDLPIHFGRDNSAIFFAH